MLAFRAPAVPDLPEDDLLAFRSVLADADEGEDGEGTRTRASTSGQGPARTATATGRAWNCNGAGGGTPVTRPYRTGPRLSR